MQQLAAAIVSIQGQLAERSPAPLPVAPPASAVLPGQLAERSPAPLPVVPPASAVNPDQPGPSSAPVVHAPPITSVALASLPVDLPFVASSSAADGTFVPVPSVPTTPRVPKRTASDVADDDVREHVRPCLPALDTLDSYRPPGE